MSNQFTYLKNNKGFYLVMDFFMSYLSLPLYHHTKWVHHLICIKGLTRLREMQRHTLGIHLHYKSTLSI